MYRSAGKTYRGNEDRELHLMCPQGTLGHSRSGNPVTCVTATPRMTVDQESPANAPGGAAHRP